MSELEKFDEEQYWRWIEELEWYTGQWIANGDYKRVEQYLKDNFSKSEAHELDKFRAKKVNRLSQLFNSYWLDDVIPVGEDSWSDLRNEVVGRGKEFYENITVEKLKEMAYNSDYNESFSYCFHFLYLKEKSDEDKRSEFQLNKPKRIEEFIEKIDRLYDEYHPEVYNSSVWNYLEGAIKEARKIK